MEVVSVPDEMARVAEFWNPHVIAELNGQQVKIARLKGEFVMHHHEHEDEMFMVLKGELRIEFEDSVKVLGESEILVIPRGVAHKPVARDETEVMLFEPKTTINTGNIENELTRNGN